MHLPHLRRLAPALLLTLGLAACSTATTDPTVDETTADATEVETDDESDAPSSEESTVEAEPAAFPVTVTDDLGEVEIAAAPTAIVSLSPAGTEMLFALGAGDLVVAADAFSNFPPEAPTTELSGFEPNVEAILEYGPDLVVSSGFAPEVTDALTGAGVPVLQFGAATTFDASFAQIMALGAATGTDATSLVAQLEADLDAIAATAEVEPGLTYYHELSTDLFSATSSTFIGEIYGLFGMENIADAADPDGFGYPQLSAEYVVQEDPDYVFLACTIFCGETAASFAEREAFAGLTAVAEGNVVELDDDVASRWGPRMVEFAESVAAALQDG